MAGIEDLENLIKARELQMGGPMLSHEKVVEQKKEESTEATEIMKLLFDYMKESNKYLSREIQNIKKQNQEILELLAQDKEDYES